VYDRDAPTRTDLPSSQQLLRSTLIAAASAAVLLVTVVLPAEYGIDPTGLGSVLRLTEMGRIKTQLAAEATSDASANTRPTAAAPAPAPAPAQAPAAATDGARKDEAPAAAVPSRAAAQWKDEQRFALAPGQGLEIKLLMQQGARAEYAWVVSGGVVNYDTHGDGSGRSISYAKGRGVPGDDGVLTAAFTGNHGWFWRNRGKADVEVVLRTRGEYSELKRAR
jgi:hypothetical protein